MCSTTTLAGTGEEEEEEEAAPPPPPVAKPPRHESKPAAAHQSDAKSSEVTSKSASVASKSSDVTSKPVDTCKSGDGASGASGRDQGVPPVVAVPVVVRSTADVFRISSSKPVKPKAAESPVLASSTPAVVAAASTSVVAEAPVPLVVAVAPVAPPSGPPAVPSSGASGVGGAAPTRAEKRGKKGVNVTAALFEDATPLADPLVAVPSTTRTSATGAWAASRQNESKGRAMDWPELAPGFVAPNVSFKPAVPPGACVFACPRSSPSLEFHSH